MNVFHGKDRRRGGNMLTYSFRDMGNDSLYEYLYKCIRRDILEGKIAAGEKLPSKRSFAKNLGISVITVENAYAQLVAEGYIYSVPKSGYYAAEIRKNLLTPENGEGDPSGGRRRERDSRSSQNREDFDRRRREREDSGGEVNSAAGENDGILIDLVRSRTDPKQFPFTIWARLLREVLSEKREALMNNAPGAGIWELRRAIAGYLLQYQNMQVSEEQIIIGAGTEYLYGLLIQLLGQDKTYALEDPGYTKLAKIYGNQLVKTVFIPMDDRGVSVERLRDSGADVMHISPSHHYPTGITTPIGRRYELLAWANEQEGRYILEDDYDCEFRMAGRPIPSLQSIDQLGRVIYMNTFTKSLTSTIRISYMVLPWELLDRFQEKLGFYSCTVSNFEQYTLALFISGGYFEKHINRMRNYYRGKRDELLKTIQESPLGGEVSILGADAGLHFLMQVDTQLTDGELIQRAGEAGVRLSCLSGYYHCSETEPLTEQLQNRKKIFAEQQEIFRPKEQRDHHVVVNYSGLDIRQMEALPEVLFRAWFC